MLSVVTNPNSQVLFCGNTVQFISKRERITLRLLYAVAITSVVCLSVCLLSVVCDVGAPYTQAVELFGNLFFTIR